MGCSKEALRIVLWMSWVIQWLFNSIFVAITLVSFTQLWEASSIYLPQGTNIYSERTWRAPMAACILSSLMVIGYDVMSCVTLVKKSINRAGPGFGFGFIVAFCFCLAFFLLLCGLILDSFRPKIKGLEAYDWTQNGTRTTDFKWQNYDTQTFIGAEVFALINFVVLLVFAVILVVLQAGVNEQLGMNSPQYAPLDAPPMLGATDGYADGIEGGQQEYRYGHEENDALRGGGNVPLGQAHAQASFNASQSARYYAADAQGYGGTAAAVPAAGAAGSVAYYGHGGAYGSSNPYGGGYAEGGAVPQQEPYAAPAAPPAPSAGLGSGLLGGQVLGSSPAPAQQTYTQTPTGYSYQKF